MDTDQQDPPPRGCLDETQVDAAAFLAQMLGVPEDGIVLIDCNGDAPRIASPDDPAYRAVAARRQHHRAREPKRLSRAVAPTLRPRACDRQSRPRARRSGSSSRSSSSDPGSDSDGGDGPPPPAARPDLTTARPARYVFALLTAEQRGAS